MHLIFSKSQHFTCVIFMYLHLIFSKSHYFTCVIFMYLHLIFSKSQHFTCVIFTYLHLIFSKSQHFTCVIFTYLHLIFSKSQHFTCASYISNVILSAHPFTAKSQIITKRFNIFCTNGSTGFRLIFRTLHRHMGQLFWLVSQVSIQIRQKTCRHGLSTGLSRTHWQIQQTRSGSGGGSNFSMSYLDILYYLELVRTSRFRYAVLV